VIFSRRTVLFAALIRSSSGARAKLSTTVERSINEQIGKNIRRPAPLGTSSNMLKVEMGRTNLAMPISGR
jgi:hypothetical protein